MIIGAAFSDIIKSLVDNVFMPIIGMIMPGGGVYENWQIGQIKIGLFIAAIVKFVIVAFILYVFIVKFIGWLMRAKETAPPPPTKSEELLMEIRDLLKAKPV